jgi:sulfite exporter TauE/SafE
MLTLLGAVIVASFLGSLHCVGMCGPLALVATTQDRKPGPLLASVLSYHGCRLIGYSLLGLMAGSFGAAVQMTGSWLGLQQAAARIAGGSMALLGILMVCRLAAGNSPHFLLPSPLQQRFGKWHHFARQQSPTVKASAIGLLTIFLPCGWLYAFLITAAATANSWSGAAVMFTFWLGTVPSLTAMLFSLHLLTNKLRSLLPWVSAVLLTMVGFYTMSHRALANYDGLKISAPAMQIDDQIKTLHENAEIKPCCQPENILTH